MGIEEEVAALRRQGAEAAQRHAHAAAGVQQAEARAAALREDLAGEFGVSTLPEALALLARLREETEREAAQVRRALELAGGA